MVILLASLAAGGCDRGASRLGAIATLSATPANGGRPAAAVSLASLFAAGAVSYEDALNAAYDALVAAEADAANTQRSADATAFAGAVLDAIATRESFMQTSGEYELFWMRVGGLAFKAAEEANAQNRVPEAASLVFAGGQRWQTDAYWNRQSHHDALAALILAQTGRRAEALTRLRARADLQPPATTVLEALTKAP
jgi:hypothetical protein